LEGDEDDQKYVYENVQKGKTRGAGEILCSFFKKIRFFNLDQIFFYLNQIYV